MKTLVKVRRERHSDPYCGALSAAQLQWVVIWLPSSRIVARRETLYAAMDAAQEFLVSYGPGLGGGLYGYTSAIT